MQLYAPKVEELIHNREESLGKGQIAGDTADVLAMNYKRSVGYLEGLRDALKLADETDTEMQN